MKRETERDIERNSIKETSFVPMWARDRMSAQEVYEAPLEVNQKL